MKDSFKYFKLDKITYRGFIASFFLAAITALYILLNYSSLPPFVPIFYQLPWGNERLMQTPGIFVPLGIFAFIFLINFIISLAVYSKNPLISRILSATTLLVAVMDFLFIARTILIII